MLLAWGRPPGVSGVDSPYHLPHVVDAVSGQLKVSTDCAEVGHAYAIRAGNEGMMLPVGSLGVPHHLPGVVYAVSRRY